MIPHVVIVGGGFGGLKAARELGNAGVRITLIDKSNHHLFQPLLYQVATAGLSPADIATPIRGVLGRQKNVEVVLGEIVGVDAAKREVVIRENRERRESFDYLILATGATHSYFGHDEWEKDAPGLKSIHDATMIRQKVLLAFEAAEAENDPSEKRRWLTFVVVGGGPTGVELSGALAELAHHALATDFRHIDPKSARIILVEAGPRVLASFSSDVALKAQRKLEQYGVEVRTGGRVQHVDSRGVTVGTGNGERIEAGTVLWAAGVVASPAGRWLGLGPEAVDRAGRVKVRPDLSVPGHPNIFVIGDTATFIQDGNPLPGVAPVALQQGTYVARLIAKEGSRGQATRVPFRYRNKGNLATVGRAFAVVELSWYKGTGFVAWVLWLVVHIYYLIGFRNRLMVLLEWAWAYATFQRGARLITTPLPAPSSSGASSRDPERTA